MAKAERSEEIEVIPEQSPVGEDQSNLVNERTAQAIEARIRCMILALESRYKNRIREDHPITSWLVRHSATILNLAQVGDNGRTAFERWKGRKFNRMLPQRRCCPTASRPSRQRKPHGARFDIKERCRRGAIPQDHGHGRDTTVIASRGRWCWPK